MFRDLMSYGGRLVAFLFLLSVLWSGLLTTASAEEGKPLPFDVRIIVDISGSMKQTDPNNLRVPALNLLTELMPEGAQAGIWTFGRYVNNLVAVAKVDDAWRAQAKKSTVNISSLGLQTNLSGALNDAAWGLSADSGFQQSIILLTDGKIDMAEADAANAEQINTQERKTLMSQVLDKYREAGANIHTLALSDLADKNLLQEIAMETEGLYSEAQDAEALMKAFLRAFDRAIPAEQVPMEDNTFVIDGSVDEFTALIFKSGASAQKTALLTPKGERFTAMSHPKSVRWHQDMAFDLITIKSPEAGTWVAEADLDPANRVTILSDLALGVTGIPATIFPGDKLDLQINLTNEGKIVDNVAILRLTDVAMKVITASGREGSKILSDPETPPADGIYREGLHRLKEMGQYQVDIVAESKTFQRKRTFSMTMIQPVDIQHRPDESKGVYRIEVRGLSDNLDTERSRVIAKIKSPDDNTIIQSVVYDEQASAWISEVEATKGPGEYRVDLNVRGVTLSGKNFKVKPDPIVFNLPIDVEGNEDATDSEAVAAQTSKEAVTQDETLETDGAPADSEAENDIAPKIEMADVTHAQPVDDAPEEKAIKEDVVSEDNEAAEKDSEADEEGLAWWVYLLLGLMNVAVIGAGVWWFLLRKAKPAVNAQTDIEAENAIADLEELEDDFAGDFDSLDDLDEEEEISFSGDASALAGESDASDNLDEDFSIDPDDIDTDDNSWGEFDEDKK